MRISPLLRIGLVACLALAGAQDARAIDNGACCVQTTSRLETLLNPQRGSDEQFFTSAGGPPNVMFILDTSCSMNAWPEDWPSARGCNHATFAGNGYDSTIDYPSFISGMTGSPGNKTPVYDSKWFNNERVFRADGNSSFFPPPSFGHHFGSSGGPGGTSWGSSLSGPSTASQHLDSAMTNACAAVTGASNRPACKTCLQSKGYFVENGTTRIATGNYLEFYSPRDVSAVMTLSQLLFSVREVRLGIMTFDDWGGSCYNTSATSPVCLWQPLGPNCNQLYPLDTSAVENQRNSILNSLSGNNPFSSSTPLASALYLAGYHLRSTSPTDGYGFHFGGTFPGNPVLNEPNSPNQKSICTACSFNAVVILTDGEPYNEVIAASNFPSAITSFTSATTATCPSVVTACASYLDETAAFLWNRDLRQDLPLTQRVATYTIGFGTNADANTLLSSTARVGGGKYYTAKGAASIKQALLDILDDIQSRNNSFASAAVAAVQTGSTSEPALLPRMLPKKGQPWEGRLWRFRQFNEFVEDEDLNGDTDKEDVFIVEGVPTPDAGSIVTESSDGTFVKAGTGTPATPFWEANAKLVSVLGAGGVDSRKIWTVLDTNGDGAFTSADTLTPVRVGSTAAEDLKLAEYMGLRRSAFCPTSTSTGSLLARFGLSLATAQSVASFTLPTTPTQDDYDRLCVRLVTRWVLGADLLDSDGDGLLGEVRQSVLGDVFHSSPILVDPPVDPFLCNLGLANQCVRTLYSQDLGGLTPTPATPEVVDGGACGSQTLQAYEAWAFDSRKRQKVALVGSNDGMIHAFVSGTAAAAETCTGGIPVPSFDDGDGREAWAFIPPDLLPKIPDLILSHEYMVDGDIMVRDIWADTSQDGRKQRDEFHTLAIVSEGRGGKHYVALELTFDSNGSVSDRPGFRWVFPQPCTEEAATFGKTFFALSPKPPPVGPILIEDSSLPATGSPVGAATPVSRYGVDTHERWVVALSGGWSPGLEKGRGVYLVDAWEGQINGRRDNLWWKFEFDESASGFATPSRHLTHSVSAPVALVDYGSNDAPGQDGFFDSAVFGDTAGQLWIARLHAPGRYSSAQSLVGNWAAARAFEMDRDGTASAGAGTPLPDGGTEPAESSPKSAANKSPFYYLPSVAIEPGTNKLRVFAGTGNRYAVLEGGAGSCRFDNPLACAKSRCGDLKVVSSFEDGVVDLGKMETHWKRRSFEHAKLDKSVTRAATATLTASDTCGAAGATHVRAANEDFQVGTCDYPSGTDPVPGQINEISYACGLDASGNTFLCNSTSVVRNGGLGDLLDPNSVDTTGLGRNRFVGFWAYGGGRIFVESPDGGRRPDLFDDDRLSDRSGQLVNVTGVGCAADGSCDGGALPSDLGWFLEYGALDQKTATGAALMASCVLWSDLSPTGGDGGTCGASITPLSRVYQADFITGQPNCAAGFLPGDGGAYVRAVGRTVVAPPPEPASVVQVSKTGEVRYSAMLVEPGQGQATTLNVSGGQDVLQLVYELPVSRTLHNCRHADGGCSTNP